MLLSIETSCDETAVAVFDVWAYLKQGSHADKHAADAGYLRSDLISSQTKLHEPYGGVVPELAAREHLKNLPLLVEEALNVAGITAEEISVVSVTSGPGLKGCLLVGVNFAKAFAFSRGIPLLALNHLEGHLFAGDLLSAEEKPEFPFLALLVSGGHTQLVLVKDLRDYQVVAQTRDDAAGEAFDKIASLLDLPYPGGPALSACATKGDSSKFQLPIGLVRDESSFSFSGLKTAVARLIRDLPADMRGQEAVRADIAASAEHAIVESLIKKVRHALTHSNSNTSPKSLVLTGGVAANRRLRAEAAKLCEAHGLKCVILPHRWCTDNAAMMAAVGSRFIAQCPEEYLQWKQNRVRPKSQMENHQQNLLGPQTITSFGVFAREPIENLVPVQPLSHRQGQSDVIQSEADT